MNIQTYSKPDIVRDIAPKPRIICLLPTGSEEREVLGFRSIPVAILPPCQAVKTIASYSEKLI